MKVIASILAAVAVFAGVASAQDPAEGWMSYATGKNPSGEGIITFMEARWKVPSNPARGGAFYSPWFGIESSDNLNLIQPVNPWTGYNWEIYNEYFQWSPENNINSAAHTVQPGDVLYGSVTYDADSSSYMMYHVDETDGWSVNTSIPIQTDGNGNPKKFTMSYFVFEKSQWACDQYPTNEQVTFYDITMEFDGKKVQPAWTTAFVDDHCDFRAAIVDESTIKMTWNTGANDDASLRGAK